VLLKAQCPKLEHSTIAIAHHTKQITKSMSTIITHAKAKGRPLYNKEFKEMELRYFRVKQKAVRYTTKNSKKWIYGGLRLDLACYLLSLMSS